MSYFHLFRGSLSVAVAKRSCKSRCLQLRSKLPPLSSLPVGALFRMGRNGRPAACCCPFSRKSDFTAWLYPLDVFPCATVPTSTAFHSHYPRLALSFHPWRPGRIPTGSRAQDDPR